MKRYILYSPLIFLLFTCAKSGTEFHIIDESIFVEIYCDVVEETDLTKPLKHETLVDSVLNHYEVSRQAFQKTVDYYSENPERWQSFFDQVVRRLEGKLKHTSKRTSSKSTQNKTNSIITSTEQNKNKS